MAASAPLIAASCSGVVAHTRNAAITLTVATTAPVTTAGLAPRSSARSYSWLPSPGIHPAEEHARRILIHKIQPFHRDVIDGRVLASFMSRWGVPGGGRSVPR